MFRSSFWYEFTCYIRKDIAGEFYITEYTDDNNLSIKNK